MTQQRPFLPAGKVHDEFTSWAEHHGIVINKVRVAAFPGAGIGIVATNDIKVSLTLYMIWLRLDLKFFLPPIYALIPGSISSSTFFLVYLSFTVLIAGD